MARNRGFYSVAEGPHPSGLGSMQGNIGVKSVGFEVTSVGFGVDAGEH